MRLQPYPDYKDSGLPWISKVPRHWDVRRLKTLLGEIDRRSATGDQILLSMTRRRGLIRHSVATKKIHSATTLVNYKICHAGEIVMNRMQAWSGMFHVAPENGLVSPDYAVFTPWDDVNTDFLGHMLRLPQMVAIFHSESKGIGSGFLRLYGDRFGMIHTTVPPRAEQDQIVRFLDNRLARINRLIKSKMRQIELLKELKQSVINSAVTRGLDPSVPLKDSGLPWCPQIPSRWVLKPNRAIMRIRRVLVGEKHTTLTLLSLTKQGVIVRDLTENKGKFSVDMGTFQEVQAGDLVMCLFDVPETPRTVGLSTYHGMITGAYTILEPQNQADGKWIESFYIAMDNQKLLSPLYSGLRKTIPRSALLATKTPTPPSEEQGQIMQYLENKTAKIDLIISANTRQLDLLAEYRTRLISDVVTGQIDVRGVAVPDEPCQAEDSAADRVEPEADEGEVTEAQEVEA